MTAVIGFLGAILGALLGAIATYLMTRSNMRLTLEHGYDQALQSKRLERYQELFHISKCLSRYWPAEHEGPRRRDLQQDIESFQDWYFGEGAGGMFLTSAAKDIYVRMLNLLADLAFTNGGEPDSPADRPLSLSAAESQALRELASNLRHQLAEDTGAMNPPGPRWTRPGPQAPSPRIGTQAATAARDALHTMIQKRSDGQPRHARPAATGSFQIPSSGRPRP